MVFGELSAGEYFVIPYSEGTALLQKKLDLRKTQSIMIMFDQDNVVSFSCGEALEMGQGQKVQRVHCVSRR